MKKSLFLLLSLFLLTNCGGSPNSSSDEGSENDDTDNTASTIDDLPSEITKYVLVFNIPVVATEDVDDEVLFHVAT